MLISPVRNKILKIWDTLFEVIETELQCSKNYFKHFLLQEAAAFGNKDREGIGKITPKIEKYVC